MGGSAKNPIKLDTVGEYIVKIEQWMNEEHLCKVKFSTNTGKNFDIVAEHFGFGPTIKEKTFTAEKF